MDEHDQDDPDVGHEVAGEGRAPPSWQARRGGSDPDLWRIGRVAGGLALVAAAVAGGWSMLGRRPHEIPLIEAPSGPLRVRPENPGGMQVASGVDATPDGAGTLAPPPEVPQPGALRAQIQAGQATQGLATGAAPDAAGPAATQDKAPPPEPAVVAPAHPAAAAPPPPVAAPAHGATVQLGALESEQAATAEWQRLARRMPELLGSRQPDVQRAEHDGRTVWRLRTGGFATLAQAAEFCAKVRAKGTVCSIAVS